MFSKFIKSTLAALAGTAAFQANADLPVNYRAEAMFNAGNGDLAPYFIASNNNGVLTQSVSGLLRGTAWKPMDTAGRFSYGFGVDFLTGATNKTSYACVDSEGSWLSHREGPAAIWLQQLYGEVKYRSLYLTAGMKQRHSDIVTFGLSSGDLIESGNARPIPQVRAGFIDFQNIPFTNGWLQLQGEIAYGKFFQNKYLENHYNYNSGQINLNTLYHYKHLYFRTNPDKPFSATFGGRFVCLFGGKTEYYSGGKLKKEMKNRTNLKAFWQAFLPQDNGYEGYYEGQHLGSWDIALRYRLGNGDQIRAYVENLWEDGSGMGKLNGWDGLWGLEFKSSRKWWITGAVVEYIDFTNQGGPMHWDPADNPGTTLTGVQATGSDTYYNNGFYNAYANFGMSIGTPFSKAPIYNTNGEVMYLDTRVRGFHVGVTGNLGDNVDYRLLGSYRKSWGNYGAPRLYPARDVSVMAEVTWHIPSVKGLDFKAQVAADRGKLYGNKLGGLISVSYSGLLNFKR